jgi:predicted PurR-regulated permease PerM
MSLDEAAPHAPPADRRGWFARIDRAALVTVAEAVIAAVVVVAALGHAKEIAFPTVLAVLGAIALAPLARRLERGRVPASLAAGLIVGGMLGGAAGTLYVLAPSATAWNDRAPQLLRNIEIRVRQINREVEKSVGIEAQPEQAPAAGVAPATATGVGSGVPAAQGGTAKAVAAQGADPQGDDAVSKLVEGGQRLMADLAISAPGFVLGGVYWAFLTFFLLRDRAALARRLMGFGTTFSVRMALCRAMRDVQADVSRYLLAITVINIGLGLSVAGAFHLIGVPNAALWGVAAGLLNFMPFVGTVVMVVVTLGVGLVSFEEPVVAFAPVTVVIVLNTIEGQLVTPMLIGARMRMSALGIFVAIAFGAWLWGAAGALIATPTLIVASAFVTRFDAVTSRRRSGARSPRNSVI